MKKDGFYVWLELDWHEFNFRETWIPSGITLGISFSDLIAELRRAWAILQRHCGVICELIDRLPGIGRDHCNEIRRKFNVADPFASDAQYERALKAISK